MIGTLHLSQNITLNSVVVKVPLEKVKVPHCRYTPTSRGFTFKVQLKYSTFRIANFRIMYVVRM